MRLVQRLLSELKQSNPLKWDWNVFKFNCLQLVITDDYSHAIFGVKINHYVRTLLGFVFEVFQ